MGTAHWAAWILGPEQTLQVLLHRKGMMGRAARVRVRVVSSAVGCVGCLGGGGGGGRQRGREVRVVLLQRTSSSSSSSSSSKGSLTSLSTGWFSHSHSSSSSHTQVLLHTTPNPTKGVCCTPRILILPLPLRVHNHHQLLLVPKLIAHPPTPAAPSHTQPVLADSRAAKLGQALQPLPLQAAAAAAAWVAPSSLCARSACVRNGWTAGQWTSRAMQAPGECAI